LNPSNRNKGIWEWRFGIGVKHLPFNGPGWTIELKISPAGDGILNKERIIDSSHAVTDLLALRIIFNKIWKIPPQVTILHD
jgi:hypothetical protein